MTTLPRLTRLAAPLLAALFALPAIARADAPPLLPVTGYLTDGDGKPETGAHRLTFMLYEAESGGRALYTDNYNSIDITNGHFVVYLGSQEDEELDLGLFRDASTMWLEIVIDGRETISPRTALGSVGYAAFAQYCSDSATLGGNTPDAIVTTAVTTARTDATLQGSTTVEGSATFEGAVTHQEDVNFEKGIRFGGRVVKGPVMTGTAFVTQTVAGTNVCTQAGYRACTGWEAMVIDTISDDLVFDETGWVIGSFPNVDSHMRSLASGQDSVVCPVGSYLTKFYSNFAHGSVPTPGGLHCIPQANSLPVWCCRAKTP